MDFFEVDTPGKEMLCNFVGNRKTERVRSEWPHFARPWVSVIRSERCTVPVRKLVSKLGRESRTREKFSVENFYSRTNFPVRSQKMVADFHCPWSFPFCLFKNTWYTQTHALYFSRTGSRARVTETIWCLSPRPTPKGIPTYQTLLWRSEVIRWVGEQLHHQKTPACRVFSLSTLHWLFMCKVYTIHASIKRKLYSAKKYTSTPKVDATKELLFIEWFFCCLYSQPYSLAWFSGHTHLKKWCFHLRFFGEQLTLQSDFSHPWFLATPISHNTYRVA